MRVKTHFAIENKTQDIKRATYDMKCSLQANASKESFVPLATSFLS